MADWKPAHLHGGERVLVARWDGSRAHAEHLGGLSYRDTIFGPKIYPEPYAAAAAGAVLIRFADGLTVTCGAMLFDRLFNMDPSDL